MSPKQVIVKVGELSLLQNSEKGQAVAVTCLNLAKASGKNVDEAGITHTRETFEFP